MPIEKNSCAPSGLKKSDIGTQKKELKKLIPMNGIITKNTLSFLSSLQVEGPESIPPPLEIHPEAFQFICEYDSMKYQLSNRLFTYYNKIVFNNKLPSSMNVSWSKRLLTTAGHYSWRKNTITLSDKVLQTPTMLLDTLLHEMCHAAVKEIDGLRGTSPHGYAWRHWCNHARNLLPEVPKITPRHSYTISYPYEYQCKFCKMCIGKMSSKVPQGPCYVCKMVGSYLLRSKT